MTVETDMSNHVLDLAVQIVSAHVSNNTVPTDQLPALIANVHNALLCTQVEPERASSHQAREPAVPIKQSVQDGRITCLDCGRSFSMLKRHIGREHNLTPGEYRRVWGLPGDYPMTAPAYSKVRSGLAKDIGLGTSGRKDQSC